VLALLTFYPHDAPSSTSLLREGESPVVGRDHECDIPIADGRVSSRHARLVCRGGAWWLLDLGSKNGTLVNGTPAMETELRDQDRISFGGVHAQVDLVSEDRLSAFLAARLARRKSSGVIRAALEQAPDPHVLLKRLVDSAVGLASAERGLVLVCSVDGPLMSHSEPPAARSAATRAASHAAVERVLSTARPAVFAAQEFSNGHAASGVSQDGAALACIPLREGSRIVGVLVLEGKRSVVSFSDHEVDMLEALVDRATNLLSGTHPELELRALTDATLVSSRAESPA
jgi:hypothetical protein